MRNFTLLAVLLLLSVTLVFGGTRYNAVAEWNGPYYRIINEESVDLKVDDPVMDEPFSSPIAVAGLETATDDLYRLFVADEDNNRVVLFETNVAYNVLDATTAWNHTGVAPAAALDVNTNVLALEEWDADETLHRIVKGSCIVKIDGDIWTEVTSLTGYAATDKVYAIDYSTTGAGGMEIDFPANSLPDADGDNDPDVDIEVYYAYTSNATDADDTDGNDIAYGAGDIDFGMTTAAATRTKVTIDETTTGGIDDIQSLRSLAAIANKTTATTTELYMLDMADNSTNGDEELFMYTVATSGAVDATPNEANTNEKYDGLLTNPEDIYVADVVGGTDADAAGAVVGGTVTDITGVTVVDASQVTGHSYEVIITALGASFSIRDKWTNEWITQGEAWPDAAGSPYLGIPGLSLTLQDFTTAETGSLTTTAANYNRYIFVADTDADRVKILKMADVTDDQFVGDWLDGDERDTDVAANTDGDTELNRTTPSSADDARNWEFYTATFPIKEGSLDTIRIGTHTWNIDPDNNLANNDSNDSLFTVDYMTGRIGFGDGTNGARVELSKTVSYTYTTSVDVIRYGESGSGPGQFANPKGITARWNSALSYFDVYVSDTDNNRIQKFKFIPGDAVTPPTMEYVTSWNTVTNGSDLLVQPTDIMCVKEGTAAALDTVWIYVVDSGNDRIVTYIDMAAIQGGGTAAPTYDNFIGQEGNDLGTFQNIGGLWAVTNTAQNFDLYVADQDRDYVQKFQEADPVSLTIAETGNSLLPVSVSPAGSYTITYTITGAFECAYVNFYYSSDTLWDASDKLIAAENSITASSGQATYLWTFSETPDGVPADGDYYIFGKVVSCGDEELAEDRTAGALTIDSDLKVAFSLRDQFDEDTYLLLQNGATKNVVLTLDYPVGVNNILINATYPTDMIEVVSINRGNIFDLEGEAVNVLFSTDLDETAGTFTIGMSQTGDPDGCNVSPRGNVAIIQIKAKDDMIDTTTRVVTGAITLDSDCEIVKYNGVTDTTRLLNNITLYGAYLCDIATPGASQGTPPSMVPLPDGEIGFVDQMIFTRGWNGDSLGNHDPISDFADEAFYVDGTMPDYISMPDGYIESYDLLAITEMFSWWTSNFALKLAAEVGEGDNVLMRTVEEDNTIRARVMVENAKDMMGAHLIVRFDPEALELRSIEDGGMLSQGRANALTLTRDAEGVIEIGISRLCHENPTVSGTGDIVELVFEKKSDWKEINYTYELAGQAADIIESGVGKSVPDDGTARPESMELLQNVPNPFNGVTSIAYEIAEDADVEITVHDILGTKVTTIVNQTMEAGHHNATWNGKDQWGQDVPTGEYLLRMEADGKVHTRRMLYLK